MSPVIPGDPLAPEGPVGPVSPVAPVAPLAPDAPDAPVAPVGPVGPVAPVGPVGPVTLKYCTEPAAFLKYSRWSRVLSASSPSTSCPAVGAAPVVEL